MPTDLSEEEWREKVRAANTALPHLPLPTRLDPTGMVPYPCIHGIAVRPKAWGYQSRTPWLDDNGDERPPAALSWGRSKYLTITAFGGRDGVPYAIVQCPVCRGEPAPADMTIPRES